MTAIKVTPQLVEKHRENALLLHERYKKGEKRPGHNMKHVNASSRVEYREILAVLEFILADDIRALHKKVKSVKRVVALMHLSQRIVERALERGTPEVKRKATRSITHPLVHAPLCPQGPLHEMLRVRPEGYNAAREKAERLSAREKPKGLSSKAVSLHPVGGISNYG